MPPDPCGPTAACCVHGIGEPIPLAHTHYLTLFLHSLVGSYESLFIFLILTRTNTYFQLSFLSNSSFLFVRFSISKQHLISVILSIFSSARFSRAIRWSISRLFGSRMSKWSKFSDNRLIELSILKWFHAFLSQLGLYSLMPNYTGL